LLGLLGPNGAGKSTAISLMLGLLKPDAGEVRLFGRRPRDVEARRQIGVMMQQVALMPELHPRELIALTCSYYPDPMDVEEVVALSNIAEFADRQYGKLSGGQKRQVQFAVAICGRPRLLFLDEPTAGLDIQARELMWATLKRLVEQGVSAVLTTHYIEEAEQLSNRIAVLAKGQLVAEGSVAEIRGVVGVKRINCMTDMDVGAVQAWPGVSQATRDAQGLHVSARNAESVVRRLLADENLADLEVRRAGLAEAFSELTQEDAA
jgi:ABC-2 type transport system ATP-binding protein